MDSQQNKHSSQDSFVLTLLPQRLPGKVIRKLGYPLLIKPLVNALPLDDGTYADKFFAPGGDANEDDYVLFQWKNPGKRGFDARRNEPGDPTAISIEVISEARANEIAAAIRQTISSELRENLQKERVEIKNREDSIDDLVNQQVQARLIEVEQREHDLNQREYELERRKQEIDNEAKLIQSEKNELSKTLQEIEPYRQAIPDLSTHNAPAATEHSPIPQNLASRWKTALHNNGLALPEALSTSYLISLLCAFYSGSLVLLNGPVGVGKTSIVKESARIINGKSKVIPVRPAWLDPVDLLGYFDPIKEVFRSSSFLKALNGAKADPSKLYLICLDELNLARIENYGADLLSTLEYSSPSYSLSETKKEQQGLLLYSESIEQDLWQEARNLQEKANKDEEDIQRLQRINTMLRSYPANFQISANTAILGTLNSDETTYDISPKIIDRAYVVTYPVADLALKLPNQSPALTQTLNISTVALVEAIREKLRSKSNPEASHKEYQTVPVLEGVDKGWQSIVQWNLLLSGLCIPLGHRTKRDFRTLYAVCDVLGLSHQDCLGYFLFLKVFPRISFLKSPETQAGFAKSLESIRNKFRELGTELEVYDPGDVLAQLETQASDSRRQYVNYWVRA